MTEISARDKFQSELKFQPCWSYTRADHFIPVDRTENRQVYSRREISTRVEKSFLSVLFLNATTVSQKSNYRHEQLHFKYFEEAE
jgi:hypothetical protein